MSGVVVIAGENLPFPSGMAGTERVKALGRVCQHAGWTVEVAVLRPSEVAGRVRNAEVCGSWEGIAYRYCGGTSVLSPGWVRRRWDEFAGMLGFARRVSTLRRGNRRVVIVGYTLSPVFALPMLIVGWCLRARYIQEVCEWLPATTNERHESLPARALAGLFCRVVVPASDGVVVISRFLAERFTELGVSPERIVRVPALMSTPCEALTAGVTNARVVFAGSGAYLQVIEFVLDLCLELKRRGRNVTCDILLGLSFEADGPSVTRGVTSRALEDRVILVGYLSRTEFEQTLASATALLIPLPETDSSRARFPNKLIEYLLTARPVVSNAIGEVAEYLTNRVDALVCRRFDPSEYADAVEWILENRDLADACGQKGRDLARKHFIPARYVREMRSLIEAGKSGGKGAL